MMVKRMGRMIATPNLVPGEDVYGERLIRKGGKEYRVWDPRRSKMAAALKKKMKIPFKKNWKVLYLGVASGTTASHISDIVTEGMVFGVDPAPRVMRDFILLSEKRRNLVPVFADANQPEKYKHIVPEVDFLYQDVAQPNQLDILKTNADAYLKKGGLAFVAVKARSIDVTANPRKVFSQFKRGLEGFDILEGRRLEPFEKDHEALLIRKE